MTGTYVRIIRDNGGLLRTEHKCEILKENKNTYTIKILNWYEDSKPIKNVQKKSVIVDA